MGALFLFAFFSFLRISNLAPYKLVTLSLVFLYRSFLVSLFALRQYLNSVKLPPNSPLFVCRSKETLQAHLGS